MDFCLLWSESYYQIKSHPPFQECFVFSVVQSSMISNKFPEIEMELHWFELLSCQHVWKISVFAMAVAVKEYSLSSLYITKHFIVQVHNLSMVSCQKGPTRHAYAWQIGPFWQDTLDVTTNIMEWKND